MLLDILYNVLGSTGMHAVYQRVQSPAGIIFMCHSVGPPVAAEFDPNGKWRITAEQLEMAIRCADKMGFEAVTLDTAVARLQEHSNNQPFYALTFDDGYADNLHTALPVCQRNRVPMMTYVTSGFIQRTYVAWWHLIEHLIANNTSIQVNLEERLSTIDCGTAADKQHAFDRLTRILTLASAQDRSAFIQDVCERYGNESRLYAENLFMNETELQEFGRNEYAHLGVHGVSHCAFASLTADELSQELQESRNYLAAKTGTVPLHLAYPYGSPSAVTGRDFKMVEQQGFASAVTTQHSSLSRGERRFHSLPRIPLFPSDTEYSLKCKLSGITTLLAGWREKVNSKVQAG